MSIYGNNTTYPLMPFQFDAIYLQQENGENVYFKAEGLETVYSNLNNAAKTDGILVGRYILVQYPLEIDGKKEYLKDVVFQKRVNDKNIPIYKEICDLTAPIIEGKSQVAYNLSPGRLLTNEDIFDKQNKYYFGNTMLGTWSKIDVNNPYKYRLTLSLGLLGQLIEDINDLLYGNPGNPDPQNGKLPRPIGEKEGEWLEPGVDDFSNCIKNNQKNTIKGSLNALHQAMGMIIKEVNTLPVISKIDLEEYLQNRLREEEKYIYNIKDTSIYQILIPDRSEENWSKINTELVLNGYLQDEDITKDVFYKKILNTNQILPFESLEKIQWNPEKYEIYIWKPAYKWISLDEYSPLNNFETPYGSLNGLIKKVYQLIGSSVDKIPVTISGCINSIQNFLNAGENFINQIKEENKNLYNEWVNECLKINGYEGKVTQTFSGENFGSKRVGADIIVSTKFQQYPYSEPQEYTSRVFSIRTKGSLLCNVDSRTRTIELSNNGDENNLIGTSQRGSNNKFNESNFNYIGKNLQYSNTFGYYNQLKDYFNEEIFGPAYEIKSVKYSYYDIGGALSGPNKSDIYYYKIKLEKEIEIEYNASRYKTYILKGNNLIKEIEYVDTGNLEIGSDEPKPTKLQGTDIYFAASYNQNKDDIFNISLDPGEQDVSNINEEDKFYLLIVEDDFNLDTSGRDINYSKWYEDGENFEYIFPYKKKIFEHITSPSVYPRYTYLQIENAEGTNSGYIISSDKKTPCIIYLDSYGIKRYSNEDLYISIDKFSDLDYGDSEGLCIYTITNSKGEEVTKNIPNNSYIYISSINPNFKKSIAYLKDQFRHCQNALGLGLTLKGRNGSVALGRYNAPFEETDQDVVLVVGNGTGDAETERSNGFVIYGDGRIEAPSFNSNSQKITDNTLATFGALKDSQTVVNNVVTNITQNTQNIEVLRKALTTLDTLRDKTSYGTYSEDNSPLYTKFGVKLKTEFREGNKENEEVDTIFFDVSGMLEIDVEYMVIANSIINLNLPLTALTNKILEQYPNFLVDKNKIYHYFYLNTLNPILPSDTNNHKKWLYPNTIISQGNKEGSLQIQVSFDKDFINPFVSNGELYQPNNKAKGKYVFRVYCQLQGYLANGRTLWKDDYYEEI